MNQISAAIIIFLAGMPQMLLGADGDTVTPAAEYAALFKEYGPVAGGMRKAKTDLERKVAVERLSTYPAKFVDLAEKHSTDKVVLTILRQAVQALGSSESAAQIAWETNRSNFPAGPRDDSARRIVAMLMKDHLQSDKLGPVIDRVRYGYRLEFEEFLLAALNKSPHRTVRGEACLALALYLNDRLQMLRLLEDRKELVECYELAFGRTYVPNLRRLGKAKLEERVETLFERAAREFADVKLRSGTVSAQARSALYDIRHLGIGKPAPEIDGKDQDGKKLKLSDYRGKVVLLYFWSEF